MVVFASHLRPFLLSGRRTDPDVFCQIPQGPARRERPATKRRRLFTRNKESVSQLEAMISRLVKKAAGVLLGILLAWQSLPTPSAGMGTGGAKSCCCCRGCDSRHCSTPACCTKPADNRGPVAPASLPVSQNEWLALATTISSWLTLHCIQADELHAHGPASASVTAVPLFQRDCCYLI